LIFCTSEFAFSITATDSESKTEIKFFYFVKIIAIAFDGFKPHLVKIGSGGKLRSGYYTSSKF